MTHGWCHDYPSAASVIPPLFSGRDAAERGEHNLSNYHSPEVDAEIDRILGLSSAGAAEAAWGRLDERIMADAPIVPLVHSTAVRLRGSRVQGAYVHPALGVVDLVAIGLAAGGGES
jgi:peptide/nickel transport system substrate-binding protein